MRIAACVVLGLFLGFVGGMVQTLTVAVAGTWLPVGTVLVLCAIVPVSRACAWWVGSRAGAASFAVAWLVATLMLGTTTPGGDLVLTSGTRQMAYLILGSMALAACSGFPLLPEDDAAEGASGELVSNDA